MGLVTALSISSFEVKIGGAKDAYGLRGWAYEVKKKEVSGRHCLEKNRFRNFILKWPGSGGFGQGGKG